MARRLGRSTAPFSASPSAPPGGLLPPLSCLLPRFLSNAADIYCELLRTPPTSSPSPNLERVLSRACPTPDASTVFSVLRRSHPSTTHRSSILRFFVWAGLQPSLRHSAAAFSAASDALQLPGHPDLLDRLLDDYRGDGVPVTARTFRILFGLCRVAGLATQSLRLLRRMGEFDCRSDTTAYNAVLRLLMAHDRSDECVEVVGGLLEEMALAGVHPDMVTFVSTVKGLCGAGRVGEARDILRMMNDRGCKPNTVVYSALVDGACERGELDTAMELVREMEKRGGDCAPNVVTYTCLMKCLCERGKLDDAGDVLSRMGQQGCIPNRVMVSTLLKALCEKGRLEEAFDLVERVVGEGSVTAEGGYSSLAASLLQQGQVEKAEKLLSRMLGSGIRPDGFARNALLRELCSKGRFLDGVRWVEEMWKTGLRFDPDVYQCLLTGTCEEGHSSEAVALVKTMAEGGIRVGAPCLDRIVKLLKKSGEPDLAGEVLREMCRRRWQDAPVLSQEQRPGKDFD